MIMKTKILTLLLAIMASVGTIYAYEYKHIKIGNLYYDLVDEDPVWVEGGFYTAGRATVAHDNSYLSFTSVTIPYIVQYGGDKYWVEYIGESAFANCSNLTNVTIEAGLHVIGSNAFENCIGITSLTLPESVSDIQSRAFSGCTNLNSINIPDRVGSIGFYAFYNCTALISVDVPNVVLGYVGTGAFYNVGNVNYLPSDWTHSVSGSPWGARMSNGYVEGMMVYTTSSKTALMACSSDATGTLTIPNSVTSIHNRAFYGCNKLTGISIPNSVTKIWNNVFHGCTGLTSLTIPNSVTSIGNGAFESCTGLTSMSIPNSVTSMGDSAFIDCINLVTLDLPNSINSIGEKFAYNCKSLYSFAIPNSVNSIGTYAFGKCTNLQSIVLDENITNVGDYAFAGCTNLEYVKLEKNITQLNTNAFSNCINLKGVHWNIPSFDDFNFSQAKLDSIIFGNNVVRVPNNICAGQNLLNKAELPDGVTVIGENSFSGCTNLGNIHFPNALQKIKANAFSGTPLHSITIPVNVDEIEANAFLGCNPKIVNWNADGTGLNPQNMDFGNRMEQLILGNEVKVIHPYLFSNQTKIKELYIPSGHIKTAAFMGCTGLQKLAFGIGVTKFDGTAFKGCNNISSALVIPDALDTIPSGAFDNCTKISSVTIGKNVKKISGFTGCTGIKTVYNFSYMSLVPHVGGVDNPAYYADRVYNNMDVLGEFIFSGNSLLGYTGNANDITLPATYKGSAYSIGSQAFANAVQIEAISIPDAISFIGSSAFTRCTGLTNITIPNSVTQIGDSTFYECSNITNISLGANLQSIGQNAFANCSSVQDLSCSAQTPPTANANSFSNVPTNATLYVPAGSLSSYQSAQGWSQFSNIVENNLVNVTGVSLNASTLTLAKKGEAVLYATVAPNNATYKTVTWSSSNTSIVTVTNGVVYGKNAGTATITCTTTNGGKSATCEVTVLASEVLATGFQFYKYAARNGEEYVPYSEMIPGDTLTFMELGTGFITVNVQPYSVTNGEVNFSVSDPSILSASLSSHINFANSIKLKPLRPGTTKITFSTTDGTNISSSVYVKITPDPTIKVTGIRILKKGITLAAKETDTLSIQIFPADATNISVDWSSADATIAGVLKETGSNRGVVTAKNLGKTGLVNIICTTIDGGFSDTCVVNVIKKRVSLTGLSLNHTSKTLAMGETIQLTPIFTPTDATNQNVYWYTDNDTIISLQNGLVQALREGVDTVWCVSEDGGFEAKCVITVQTAPESISVTGVTLDKTTMQIEVGESVGLTASILPADATNKQVTWTSSKPSVATVSSGGVVKGISAGNVTITCTTVDGGFKATCQVVVSEASEQYETMYLLGNIASGDWSVALEMEKVSANKFQVVETLTQPTSYFCFVYDLGDGTWDYLNAHRFGGNNNMLLSPGVAGTLVAGENCFTAVAGTYIFAIDMNSMTAWIEDPTSVDNVPINANKATKIFHNGQLFILLPDGTKFSATGVKVE